MEFTKKSMIKKKLRIGIIGLGYVGLPLAVAFAKHFNVVGYDSDKERIAQLNAGNDKTKEVNRKELLKRTKLVFSSKKSDLNDTDIYIIAVPTPVNKSNKPDLSLLINACKLVSKSLKQNNIIILESTVYPGTTEETCVPIFERGSKLTFNKDFFCGYSPERMNPGDVKHDVTNIVKVVSGSTQNTTKIIKNLYKKIVKAGIFVAASIKTAEAAKVIENAQRDINIAFMNELSIIFERMNIDTSDVLKAAKTKWNFVDFSPGLVGGHCIGVDPYYLTYKSNQLGYQPEIISAGRKINDQMGYYVAKTMLNKMKNKLLKKTKYKILILGYSFKEDCNDYRNTRVKDIYYYLLSFKHRVEIYDPLIAFKKDKELKNINFIKRLNNNYDGIIIAVAHSIFKKMGLDNLKRHCNRNNVIYDIKDLYNSKEVDLKL